MNLQKIYPIIFAVFSIYSCQNNFKDVQNINKKVFLPIGDAEKINLKYTDSGYIKTILIAPRMLDFGNVAFPFIEFPNGMNMTLFDEKEKKTTIVSNYAISYNQTGQIDLQGKVKITSQNGQMLETEQLYYDQANQWFFTEKKFKLTDIKGVSYGKGIDFSGDFKVVNSQRISGELESE